MTDFNEESINRDASGKFAPKVSGEPESVDLSVSDHESLNDYASERFAVDSPELAEMIGADEATVERSDWDEVTVRATRTVAGFDAVDAQTESAHRRLTSSYVATRFGATLDSMDDDGVADLTWSSRHDADETFADVSEALDGSLHADGLDDTASLGEGLRETYSAWGVDPDGKTERGARVYPDLKSQPVADALERAEVYRKNVSIQATRTSEAGTLTTTLADGSVETTKTYAAGDYIVTNPGGEQYTMSADKFADRYDAAPDGSFLAKGRVRAVPNPTGHPITVQARWGEQHGSPDCYIAEVYNTNDPNERSVDRYIIAGDEFRSTYASMRGSA